MPALLFPSLTGMLSCKTHRYTVLWRVERTDGAIFRFTNHDAALSFNYLQALAIPGSGDTGTFETYTPTGGLSGSAAQKQAGMQDHNVDVMGVIDSDFITEQDLRNGQFRDAKVIEILTDWMHPTIGAFQINTYYIAGLTYTKDYWKATVSSLPIQLRRPNGWVYSHACRYDLFDKNCTLDPTLFVIHGVVSTVVNSKRTFTCTALNGKPIGYYAYGRVVWSGGFVNGLVCDVKNHSALGRIELQLDLPGNAVIFVGDTFDIYPGCDKLKGTCLAKFSNLVNFGGYPYIPGTDRIIRGPV